MLKLHKHCGIFMYVLLQNSGDMIHHLSLHFYNVPKNLKIKWQGLRNNGYLQNTYKCNTSYYGYFIGVYYT